MAKSKGKDIAAKKVNAPAIGREINFIKTDRKKTNLATIGFFLIFLVCLALFVWFGIVKPMREIDAARKKYQEAETRLATVKKANEIYDEVKFKYDTEFGTYMTEEEISYLKRTGMLDMLEDDILSEIPIRSIAVSNDRITVNTGNTTLPKISELLQVMQLDSRNSYVTVTTTAADSQADNEFVAAVFQIIYDLSEK